MGTPNNLARCSGIEGSLTPFSDSRTRILMALIFVLFIVTTPAYELLMFLIYAGLIAWGTALARLPLRRVFGRASIVLPFSLVVALGLPFYSGGSTVTFLGLELSVTGLWILVSVSMKSFLCAATVVLLVAVTPVDRLTRGLHGLGVPALLLALLNLTYRYLFIMREEAVALKRAAVARGYRPKWLPQAAVVGRLIGTLFLRSYYRAENVYAAMRLRGYRGTMQFNGSAGLNRTNIIIAGIFIFVLVLVRLFVRYLQ